MDTTTRAPSPNGSAATTDPEHLLDQLLRQIITGFFVLTDGQGALSKWSDPAELLFGLEAEDALMEPFFGKLVARTGLTPEGEAWRAFLETGETPGTTGRLRVDAHRPGGGTFALEAVFVPVKLDEGFDFSLFLEDLAFELPVDMMLMRMRQQHPVVIRALRGALIADQVPWEGLRTAGTLVAFRPLDATPWMDEAMARREQDSAAADAELQSRIEMYDAPSVTGTDVYDLEDARAVIDRLKWATERIEDLEERSRISEDAVQLAADARVRAEAAERAALDARAEISGVLADRPVDSAGEASRLELLARMERVERAAAEAAEAAAAQRLFAETERARVPELEAHRVELVARLEHVEHLAGSTSAAEAAVAEARAELSERMEAIERSGPGGAAAAQAANEQLLARLDAAEHSRAQDVAALRADLERLRAVRDVRPEIETLRARADAASSIHKRGEEREAAAMREAEVTRAELRTALERVEQLSEETARVRSEPVAPVPEPGLPAEDRQRLELATQSAEEARAGLEAIRVLAEELRTQSAELRDEGGRLQARLNDLQDGDGHARHDVDSLRRDQEELRGGLEELRHERDEARATLREALRAAEEAKTLAIRGPGIDPDGPAPAAADDVAAARARLDELAAVIEATESRVEEARAEAVAARADAAEVREEAREAQQTAREVGERVDMADRGAQNLITEVRTQKAKVEEIAALTRSAQQDASESRADAGEARGALARLERVVDAGREQMQRAVADAAGAREQAAASVREATAGVGEAARTATAAAIGPLTDGLAEVRERLDAVAVTVHDLREAPADTGDALEALRADVDTLRSAMGSAEGGDAAAAELGARLTALEHAAPGVDLDVRTERLREDVAGALAELERVGAELSAARTDDGAGRQAVEQRLADTAAELLATREDSNQARRGLEGLREELTSLREYAAAARAEAGAAKDAAAGARRAGAEDERRLDELRTEIRSVVASVQEYKHGFEEARQAAVLARREAESARTAAERAGVVNEVTTEKFTEVWQRMLTNPAPPPTGSDPQAQPVPGPARTSKPKEAPTARAPRAGFDDEARPMAVLDLKGRFKQLNPAFTKLVGYQEHEFSKAAWPSVLDRQLYKGQKAEFDEMVTGDRERALVQSTYMHGQGIMVLMQGEVRLVRDGDGEPNHLLLVTDPSGPGGNH